MERQSKKMLDDTQEMNILKRIIELEFLLDEMTKELLKTEI